MPSAVLPAPVHEALEALSCRHGYDLSPIAVCDEPGRVDLRHVVLQIPIVLGGPRRQYNNAIHAMLVGMGLHLLYARRRRPLSRRASPAVAFWFEINEGACMPGPTPSRTTVSRKPGRLAIAGRTAPLLHRCVRGCMGMQHSPWWDQVPSMSGCNVGTSFIARSLLRPSGIVVDKGAAVQVRPDQVGYTIRPIIRSRPAEQSRQRCQ